jgi:hypothetical protein
MKTRAGNRSAKRAGGSGSRPAVLGALLGVLAASACAFGQEAGWKPGVSPEQQKRLDLMKSRGTEASLTILPVRLGGRQSEPQTAEARDFREGITEIVGLMLEKKGLRNIELGKAAFDPKDTTDAVGLAAALAEFVKQHPVTTEYVLYAEMRADGLSAIVVDKTGAVVWTDQVTAQEEPFKAGRPEPMAICLCLAYRLGPQLGLNQRTAQAAKPGKFARLMAERSGLPPEEERAALPERQAEMKKALPKATLVVLGVRVRSVENAPRAASAAELAEAITDAGLCKAEPAKHSLLLKASQEDPNEAKVMWDLAREFRDYVRKNPTDADYVLYADYRFNPEHWRQGYVHFIVCDRKGEWVFAEVVNSHFPAYQNVKPTSRNDCDKVLINQALCWYLAAEAPEAAVEQTREWKALNRLVGQWEIEEMITVPIARQVRVSLTATWTLGDRFLQMKGKSGADNSDLIQMAAYNPKGRVLRGWWFSSLGYWRVASGRWDEQTNTIFWKGEDSRGMLFTATNRFVDEDHREWTHCLRDTEGEIIYEASGKATRQKKQSPSSE